MKENEINNGRDKLSNLISYIENIIIELIIIIKKINFYFFYFLTKKFFFLKHNKILKNKFLNQKVFIIGLGPSLKNYDLKKLKNTNVIMVNRSFRIPEYNLIQPKFHFFIDNKLAYGRWPITYIDEVISKVPNINIVLNANWFYLDKFKKFRENKNIYWIKLNQLSLFNGKYNYDLTKIISHGPTVIECAITFSVYLGFKNINILGVEGNGLSRLMCNENSHWDGKDPDYERHDSLLYANDMISSSRGIRQWHSNSKNLKKLNIKIYNLTKEGILDAYQYKDYDEAINN